MLVLIGTLEISLQNSKVCEPQRGKQVEPLSGSADFRLSNVIIKVGYSLDVITVCMPGFKANHGL